MLPFLAITTTGFASTIGQIVILRELLVRFQGNELSIGIILNFWLIWNALGCRIAGRYCDRNQPDIRLIGFFLLLLACMLPIIVMLIRAAGIIWDIAPGEIPTVWPLIQLSLLSTGLFSPFSGALFSLCWAFSAQLRRIGNPMHPVTVFMGEGIGAAIGGLLFYFVLINRCTTLTSIWITSGLILVCSGALIKPWRVFHENTTLRSVWIIATLLLMVCSIGERDPIERISRQWQWGEGVVAVADTPLHHLSLTRQIDQYSLFADGLWLFSIPDPPSAEHAVHPALLQHPAPKTILLLGGGIAGLIAEILKHPGIERIDYLESDPELIRFAAQHLPPETGQPLDQPGLYLISENADVYLRQVHRRYDIILMSVGDPVNAGMNRYYTEEFFTRIRRSLTTGGVFSFAVSGGEDMLGETQERYLRTIYRTLKAVFTDLSLYPGDHFRFFATSRADALITRPEVLSGRIVDRKLSLSYVRPDTLEDRLNPFRIGYFESLLTRNPDELPNRDFTPTCYRDALILWSAQGHPRLKEGIQWLATRSPSWLWGLLAITGGGLFLMTRMQRISLEWAVRSSVIIAGGATMILQLVLLLAFQILAGELYLEAALIISAFMAGLAAGAAWIVRKSDVLQPTARLKRVQILLGLYPLLLIGGLHFLHGEIGSAMPVALISGVFPALSFIAGMLGGAIFSLAVATLREKGFPPEKSGAPLYALDLAGAAMGLLLATMLLLPVYGIIQALIAVSGITLVGVFFQAVLTR